MTDRFGEMMTGELREHVRRLAFLMVGLALVLRMDGVVLGREWFSVSHYANVNGAPPFGITASGQHTRPGICACGPSYDFGTVFLLDNRAYVCEDRGGLITDNHLDLWVQSEKTALRMGRRSEWAWVVEEVYD